MMGQKMQIVKATAHLRGISPYSQSKHIEAEKLERETHADYETRTWRERMHVNAEDRVYIPPMAFKNCLSEAAKFLSVQVPGKGKSTYTKHVEAGVLVMEPVVLPLARDDVEGEWLFVPSDGRRGGSSRVSKCFPLIPEWEGEVVFEVFDPAVTEEVFRYHLEQAGLFIGIGRFRPRNNGFYGRFEVVSIDWNTGE